MPFSREISFAIRAYIRREIGRDFDQIAASTPLFLSERGIATGKPMSRDALRTLIYRLADTAGIQHNTKCSPHVFRHTCAAMSLLGGAPEKTLGKDFEEYVRPYNAAHESPYIDLTQFDMRNQHQNFSPADRIKWKKAANTSLPLDKHSFICLKETSTLLIFSGCQRSRNLYFNEADLATIAAQVVRKAPHLRKQNPMGIEEYPAEQPEEDGHFRSMVHI